MGQEQFFEIHFQQTLLLGMHSHHYRCGISDSEKLTSSKDTALLKQCGWIKDARQCLRDPQHHWKNDTIPYQKINKQMNIYLKVKIT